MSKATLLAILAGLILGNALAELRNGRSVLGCYVRGFMAWDAERCVSDREAE